jgi:hypothetical protein
MSPSIENQSIPDNFTRQGRLISRLLSHFLEYDSDGWIRARVGGCAAVDRRSFVQPLRWPATSPAKSGLIMTSDGAKRTSSLSAGAVATLARWINVSTATPSP